MYKVEVESEQEEEATQDSIRYCGVQNADLPISPLAVVIQR